MDNTSVFQTDDPGSIPGTGSAGCVGKVSRWPHKPCIRVRVPYPLFRIALCRGIQAGKVCQINGVVAQMEEHLPCKQKAAGSKPVGSISPKYVDWKNKKRRMVKGCTQWSANSSERKKSGSGSARNVVLSCLCQQSRSYP